MVRLNLSGSIRAATITGQLVLLFACLLAPIRAPTSCLCLEESRAAQVFVNKVPNEIVPTLASSPKAHQHEAARPKSKTAQQQQQASLSTSSKKTNTNSEQQQTNCEYDKGQWQACGQEGVQQRTLTLKAGSSEACERTKTIRRDCKPAGCKYARGEWSSTCQDGRRVRVDTLVDRIGNATNCKPERRVTKDCKRACHYVKSAWSECSEGVRTRNLTLDELAPRLLDGLDQRLVVTMAPAGQHCARQKLVKRDCRPTVSVRPAAPAGRTVMTANQKRRLKQQPKQQQGTTTASSRKVSR